MDAATARCATATSSAPDRLAVVGPGWRFAIPVFRAPSPVFSREWPPPGAFPQKNEQAPRLTAFREQWQQTRQEIAALKADLERGYSTAIADVLRRQEAREVELADLVQQEEALAARPADRDWNEFRDLAAAL